MCIKNINKTKCHQNNPSFLFQTELLKKYLFDQQKILQNDHKNGYKGDLNKVGGEYDLFFND